MFSSPLSLTMRILSGIQPSGALHVGNYFGMMKPAIELQEKGEAFYFIANYHSMTSLFDAAERRHAPVYPYWHQRGFAKETPRRFKLQASEVGRDRANPCSADSLSAVSPTGSRQGSANLDAPILAVPRRLTTCDTADCQSALQRWNACVSPQGWDIGAE